MSVPQPVMMAVSAVRQRYKLHRSAAFDSIKLCSDVWRPFYTQDSFDVLVNAMAQVLQLGKFRYSTVTVH